MCGGRDTSRVAIAGDRIDVPEIGGNYLCETSFDWSIRECVMKWFQIYFDCSIRECLMKWCQTSFDWAIRECFMKWCQTSFDWSIRECFMK